MDITTTMTSLCPSCGCVVDATGRSTGQQREAESDLATLRAELERVKKEGIYQDPETGNFIARYVVMTSGCTEREAKQALAAGMRSIATVLDAALQPEGKQP